MTTTPTTTAICPVCGTTAPLTHCCPGCGACSEGRTEAARYATREEFWSACSTPSYLTWWLRAAGLVGERGTPERRRLVRCAAAIAETALESIQDEHTRDVATATVQCCYAYAEGEATLEDLDEHRRECWAAAWAAWAAAADADAAYAANAAAYAAYAAYAAAAAAADAQSRARSCDIIRAHYECPPLVQPSRAAA